MTSQSESLANYAIFSGMLAFVGLPIYIHAPKFYVTEYDVSLTAIGIALLALRMVDFIQDPLLGKLADSLRQRLALLVSLFGVGLIFGFFALFAVIPPIDPLIWFLMCLLVVFTCFSFLSISFYARGVAKAEAMTGQGHIRLAAWRESGALIGVCLAAILPFVFIQAGSTRPLAIFAGLFALMAFGAIWVMRREWKTIQRDDETMQGSLRDPILRRLLIVGLFNAAPMAVTSSLFLFFVEYRIGDETAAGPLLLLFFLSAAISVPVWNKLAQTHGPKKILQLGMLLSILAFAVAISVTQQDLGIFALVCVGSGAALGADMVLLPALFARRIGEVGASQGVSFGLWNFCSKFTLALAAATVLPILERSGFDTAGQNPQSALVMLTILYAVVPCVLKFVAFLVLTQTNLKEATI